MDDQRFDRLARTLAQGTSRRRALAGMILGIGGLVGARDRPIDAAQCTRLRSRCATDAECCSGRCEATAGIGRCACPAGQRSCGDRICCPPGHVCQYGACVDQHVCPDGSPPCRNRCWPACGFEAARDPAARCRCQCPPGTDACGQLGVCVDVTADPANCGACGARCDPGEVCAEGACGLPCETNFDCEDPPFVCTFGTCPFGACFVVAVDCFPGLQCCKTIDDVICVEGACP